MLHITPVHSGMFVTFDIWICLEFRYSDLAFHQQALHVNCKPIAVNWLTGQPTTGNCKLSIVWEDQWVKR